MRHSIYFHHVGKTGGTSLGTILAGAIGQDQSYPHHGISRALLEGTHRFRLFAGHYPYDVVQLLPQPLRVVTTVREPVAHVVSMFNHLRRLGLDHVALRHRTRPLESLDDFLADPVLARISTNMQTFSVGRSISAARLREAAERIDGVNWTATGTGEDFWCLYGSPEDDRHDPALLARGLERLNDDHVVAVGCEQIDAAINAVLGQLGIVSVATASTRLNVAPRDEKTLRVERISPQQRREIENRTRLDHALHKAVTAAAASLTDATAAA
jgi:hypothetical protein